MSMKFSTRELVTVAVFGTLWGVVEMSFGTVLKSLNIPLSGVVLSAIGLTIAMIGRIFVPRRGSTLVIGIIATLLKLFSLGGVVMGPMIGIMSEAVVAEVVLSLFNRQNQVVFLAAGGAGVLCPLVQPFVTGPLLFGRSLFTVWLDLLDTGSRLLGLDSGAAIILVAVMVLIYVAIGFVAGILAWQVGRQIQARMGRSTASVSSA
jgi:hypothetical protein